MRHAPEQPGDQAGQVHVAELQHGRAAPDRGDVALVAVLEGRRRHRPAGARRDHVRHIGPHLLRGGRDARHRAAVLALDRRGVADDEHLRAAGHAEVLVDDHPARVVALRPDPAAGFRGHDARGPDHRRGLETAALEVDAGLVAVRHPGAGHDLDAHPLQRLAGVGGEVLRERRQHARPGLDQDDAGGPRVDVAELIRHHVPRDLDDRARELDAGRARAHDREGQQPLALGRIVRELGALEGDQQPTADDGRVLDALEAGRPLLPLVIAEIGVRHPGREHQLVIGHRDRVGDDLPVLEVDAVDRAEQHAHVLLPPQHVADRPGDVGGRQLGGGDLVEQRLEAVVVVAVQNRDVDICLGELRRDCEPAEAGPDDHHSGPPRLCDVHPVCSFQGKAAP